jgi:4-amino-4-deoxy-L-arabinose transferase-like glycosyltransferase
MPEQDISIDHRQKWALIGLLTVLGIALRLANASGLAASDDMAYSEYARQIAQGTFELEPNHFALRLGLTIPVAAAYTLFGVGEWSTVLVPLIASSLSVPLVVMIGWQMFGYRVGMLAGVLFATFPLQLRVAGTLLPEAMAEFYLLAAVLAYLRAMRADSDRRFVAAGICVGIAYLTKEPALFVFPALLVDSVIARRWRGAMWLVAGLGAVVLAEHVHYLVQSGDLLFRPHSMKLHETSGMALAANENLAYRLTRAYPRMMLVPDGWFGVHSLFCILMGAIAVFSNRVARYRVMLILWSVVPFAYLNFGSSSLTRYFALPVQPRYIELVYPPLFLLTASLVERGIRRGDWSRRISTTAIGLLAVVGFACGLSLRGEGTYTGDVAVLREIAKKARKAGTPVARFDGEKAGRWRRTMMIIDGSVVVQSPGTETALVVLPDSLGLPTARSIEQVTPHDRLE